MICGPRGSRAILLLILAPGALAGCPRPATPSGPAPVGWSRAIGDGASAAAIRGLDIDDAGGAYVAITRAAATAAMPDTTITSIAGTGDPWWTWQAAAIGGPVAFSDTIVVAAISPAPGRHAIQIGDEAIELRGDAGCALVGLDPQGMLRWHQAVSATDWAVIAAIDGNRAGDVVAVGSFAGTLRIGDAVVTSAGNSDGFAVRLDAKGRVRWLVRDGGPGADALTAVAIAGPTTIATKGPPNDITTIAVAGAITGEADFRGTPLVAHNPRIDSQDIAVVALDAAGMPRWGRVIGGDSSDSASGVGILADGTIAVAGTVRDVLHADDYTLAVRGTADVIVATFSAAGDPLGTNLLGADDIAGARGLAIAPDGRIVVAGVFSGLVRGPGGDLTAAGGDDAFIATIDRTAHVVAIDPITGDGREDIVAIASSPAGVALAIAHTAELTAFGQHLPAPADPTGGIAIFVRP